MLLLLATVPTPPPTPDDLQVADCTNTCHPYLEAATRGSRGMGAGLAQQQIQIFHLHGALGVSPL